MSNALTHQCPIEGCETRVVNSKLMCSSHWGRVSANTAREVYAAFKAGRGSVRHLRAMRAAIREAEVEKP